MHFQNMLSANKRGTYLVKPRSIKLRSFITRLQELNAYLEEFPHDTEGQETAPLPADEIIAFYAHHVEKQDD